MMNIFFLCPGTTLSLSLFLTLTSYGTIASSRASTPIFNTSPGKTLQIKYHILMTDSPDLTPVVTKTPEPVDVTTAFHKESVGSRLASFCPSEHYSFFWRWRLLMENWDCS